MEIIDEAKESIKKGIEKERLKINSKYDKDKEHVDSLDNIPELMRELVSLYGNSIEQRDIMIQILNKQLKANFFKDASIGRGDNSIVSGANNVFFNKGDYSIGFGTSRIHAIIISRKEDLRKPGELFNPITKDMIKVNDLWDEYVSTGEGYDRLVQSYSFLRRQVPSDFILRVRLKTTNELQEFILDLKKNIKNADIRRDNWENEMKEYKEEKEVFFKVMKDIKDDLLEFTNKGWHIKYNNLSNLIKEDKDGVIVDIEID